VCAVAAFESGLDAVGSLRELSLDMLRAEAWVQERRFARRETSDQAAGLELFRRAITERDDDAWDAIMIVYREGLIAQAGRNVLSQLVGERIAVCADLAFERFWHATRSGCVQKFDDLGAILKYLKMCFGSVLLDEARARRRRLLEVPLEELSGERCLAADASSHVIDEAGAEELWYEVKRQLASSNERLVAYLSLVRGLTPAEIAMRHPDRFETVIHVYRVKRNILVRLRRSPSIQRWRDENCAVLE
jgi:hypothetical protein